MGIVSSEVLVEKILFSCENYAVFSARLDDGSYLRVRTHKLLDLVPGEMYRVTGKEVPYRDPTGRCWQQIITTEMTRVRLSGLLVGKWLEGLPNIGTTRARRLLDAFGNDLANVLADVANIPLVAAVLDPAKTAFANRIAATTFAALAARNARDTAAGEELQFLTKLESLGVTEYRAARSLWRLVAGEGSVERLIRNPYLSASILPWVQADHVGKCLLTDVVERSAIATHPHRLLGAVDSAWREILAEGDTAATAERFAAVLRRRGVPATMAISLALDKGSIKRREDLFRAPGAAWLEDDLASKLRELEIADTGVAVRSASDLTNGVEEAQIETGLALYPEQAEAVQKLLTLPLAVLQGGAGVGKTTVMKVLVTTWERLGGSVIMGALAGKAALQLSRGTSTPSKPRIAYTVARLIRMLEESKESNGNSNGRALVGFDNKTLLILDEASMLDTPSLHRIVSCLPTGARILLVGDQGQLPPVGIGRVFHDLVQDGSRVVKLNTVRRQSAQSPVPAAAVAIRSGIVPEVTEWSGQDGGGIFLMRDRRKLLGLYAHLSAETDDLMVVAARRETVDVFNNRTAQQHRLEHNGDLKAIRLGPLASVAKGDYVVCTRNRYGDNLFNGLLGRVTEASPSTGVYVRWDGEMEPRLVTPDIGADIELAYAITCHRAQGSAAKVVIVVVEESPLVTREWLYTAVTRTRDTVILVGDIAALKAAVGRRVTRVTGFKL